MTNQVEIEPPVVEEDDFSWSDTSTESVETFDQLPPLAPMTPQRQLAVAYNVFAGYASRKQGNYPDMIMRDLRLAGVVISGREELLWICNSLSGYFLIKESDRYFTFSWQGAANENVQQSKRRFPKVVMFSVLALTAFVSVSIVAVSFAHSRAKVIDESLEAKDFSVMAVAMPVSAVEVVKQVQAPANNQGNYDSVNTLIDSGHFALALTAIRNSASSDFSINSKKRINVLVLQKSDSLGQVIKNLVEEKKYFEAFELEQRFDKDVFQLKSSGFSRQLRQDLISDWIYSYKGWASKEEAVEDVTGQIRRIMKSSNYEVVKGEGDKFYLEYGPSKNRKKV